MEILENFDHITKDGSSICRSRDSNGTYCKPHTSFVARFWTLSSCSISFLYLGCHTTFAYSRCGRTSALMTSTSLCTNDLLISPSSWPPLATMCPTCPANFNLSSVQTPWSFSSVLCSRGTSTLSLIIVQWWRQRQFKCWNRKHWWHYWLILITEIFVCNKTNKHVMF